MKPLPPQAPAFRAAISMPPNSRHPVRGEVMQCGKDSDPASERLGKEPTRPATPIGSDALINTNTRCLALEQAYVHEVYSQIARERGACSPVRSHIKEFVFEEFEVGSLVLDVGCGDGKYVNINPSIVTIGLERCSDWFSKPAEVTANPSSSASTGQFLLGDVFHIPFIGDAFDGLLCCGVLHHISTTERRIQALREMARLLRVGGKVLISVWAFEGREIASQDVLIKWDSGEPEEEVRLRQEISASCLNSSDGYESSSASSCSTTSTTYVNRRAAYESCNSPTSEYGRGYGIAKNSVFKSTLSPTSLYHHPAKRVPRTLIQKDNLLSAADGISIELHSGDLQRKTTSQSSPGDCDRYNQGARRQGNSSVPIESSQDSPRRQSLKEQCGSFVAMIRESILLKAIRGPDEKQSKGAVCAVVGKLLHHISNLPVVSSVSKYSSAGNADQVLQNENFDGDAFGNFLMPKNCTNHSEDATDLRRESLQLQAEQTIERENEIKRLAGANACKRILTRIFQKSFSSDSIDSKKSRQQSLNTESGATTNTTENTSASTYTSSSSSRLVAYYSMPELRSLERLSELPTGCVRHKRITDLHPITFLEVDEISLPRPEVKRESSQDTEAAIDEMEALFHSVEIPHSKCSSSLSNHRDEDPPTGLKNKLQLELPNAPLRSDCKRSPEILDGHDEEEDKRTQRSSSVEYKAKISPSYRQNLRRFSASPSHYVTKTLIHFFQEENQHETHPSVDSEESFVTIIPAYRSCRGSFDVANDTGSMCSYLDDVMGDTDQQNVIPVVPDEPLSETHSDNLRLMETTPSGQETSCSNHSSKSLESFATPSATSGLSTPSPPASLHRYFHLFRAGELEDLIANNVERLHVSRSYYSEHASSWVVVCEKMQVWTI